jgi:mannosyltransferase OCH1-like enzyme
VIPRIIHQTWRDADAPLAALVASEYPDLAPIYHAYPEAIMRVALGRYLILRSFGGLYADLDAEALAPWVLLVDARLHRAGIGFPETPYRHLIETEGLGALLRDHGIEMVGLPNLEAPHANA